MSTLLFNQTGEQRQAAALLAELAATVDRIRADPNLSDAGTQRAIASAFLETQRRVAALRQAEDDRNRHRVRDLERRLFGAAGDSADPSTAISRRDASDRAGALDSPDDALELLGRAERGGDTILARAVAETAWQRHWQDVLDAYTDERPAAAAALAELAAATGRGEARGRRLADTMARSMSFSVPVPRELAQLVNRPAALAALAEGRDPAAPAERTDLFGRR